MTNTVIPYDKMIEMIDKKLESIKQLFYKECEELFDKTKEQASKRKPKKILGLFNRVPILDISDINAIPNVYSYLDAIDKKIVQRSVYNDECKQHLEFRSVIDTKTVRWVEELNKLVSIAANLKLAIENQVEYQLSDYDAEYLNRLT